MASPKLCHSEERYFLIYDLYLIFIWEIYLQRLLVLPCWELWNPWTQLEGMLKLCTGKFREGYRVGTHKTGTLRTHPSSDCLLQDISFSSTVSILSSCGNSIPLVFWRISSLPLDTVNSGHCLPLANGWANGLSLANLIPSPQEKSWGMCSK